MPLAPPPAVDWDQQARLATLAALRRYDDLARDYVLKGGLVLEHVYGSPRVSDDIDLNHAQAHPNDLTEANVQALRDVCARLGDAVAETAGAFGLRHAELHVVKWSRLLPTVFADVRYRAEPDGGEPAEGAIEVQVTLCERVYDTVLARIDGVPVLASTLNDLVADKLKVLLQQRRRHKVRHSDVFDLWYALAKAPFVPDPQTVRDALLVKMESWPEYLPLTAGAFRQEAVRTFAEQGYRSLRAEQPDLPFAPFDVVWNEIQAFVDAMGLPEGDGTAAAG